MGLRMKLLQLLHIDQPSESPPVQVYDAGPDQQRLEAIRQAKTTSERAIRSTNILSPQPIRRPTGVLLGDMTGNQAWKRMKRGEERR